MKTKISAMDQRIGALNTSNLVIDKIKIRDLEFVHTCFASNEHYDVFDADGNQVGYVSLHWGRLKCEYPDFGGEIIYAESLDDCVEDCFADEDERRYFLEDIANAIHRRMAKVAYVPFKRVRCIKRLKKGVYGLWFEGTRYNVVRYDKESKEWYIKDECGETGVVDAADFDDYFQSIDDSR